MGEKTTKQELLSKLFQMWQPQTKTEIIPLEACLGRTTAKAYYAQYDMPVYRASQMDGIAVPSELFADGMPDTSEWIAGKEFARADTGDDFPDAYDTIIAIENVTIGKDNGVDFSDNLNFKPGMGVSTRGSKLKAGDFILDRGVRLNSSDMSALAMGGIDQLEVYCKPRVAYIPTGSELIPLGQIPQRGQNISSNTILINAMVDEMGGEAILFPIIKDEPDALLAAMKEALEMADAVIINGGSSKGEEDFNAEMLAREGELVDHWAAAVPGRPICVAVVDGKPVVNLPGPPLASFHGMDWCVRAIIASFFGTPPLERQKVMAEMTHDLNCPAHLEYMCRISLSRADDGHFLATAAAQLGSLAAMCSNAIFYSLIGDTFHKKGDLIEVEVFKLPSEI